MDGVCALSVAGELDLWTAPALCSAVEAHFDRPLLLDLSQMAFCDSTGLRAIHGVAQEARAFAAKLVILAPQRSSASRAFEIAGAPELLPLAPDAETALAWLKRAAGYD